MNWLQKSKETRDLSQTGFGKNVAIIEKLRYAGSMSDLVTEAPTPPQSIPKTETGVGISRRVLIGGVVAAGTVGIVAAEANYQPFRRFASLIGEGLHAFFNRPTEDQLKAAQELEREGIQRFNYQVRDNPEVQEYGLSIRKEPRIPIKGQPPTSIGKLKPGDKITNAIEWPGQNYRNTARQEGSINWLAFKDQAGRVGFVANDDRYLEPITEVSNP